MFEAATPIPVPAFFPAYEPVMVATSGRSAHQPETWLRSGSDRLDPDSVRAPVPVQVMGEGMLILPAVPGPCTPDPVTVEAVVLSDVRSAVQTGSNSGRGN